METQKTDLCNLQLSEEKVVQITGFVHNQRIGKSVSFLTLRQGLNTIQCVYSKKDLRSGSSPGFESQNENILTDEINNLTLQTSQNQKDNKPLQENEKAASLSSYSEQKTPSEDSKKKISSKDKRAAKKATRQKTVQNRDPTNNPYTSYTKITPESFVRISGTVLSSPNPIKSCTIQNLEVHIKEIYVFNISNELPFSFKDANASLIEREALGLSTVKQDLLLDHKFLDLRLFHTNCLFRVISSFMHYVRDFLHKNNFIEIKTPKMIQNSSEGGANLFEVNFFKKKAYLAQSPQLYKQMAVIGGLQRVYEIGHVYRAEESNQNRYLSEFVGIDLEFEISDYMEVVNLVYSMLTFVFQHVNKHCENEISVYRKVFPFEDLVFPENPVVVTFEECRNLLKSHNLNINSDLDDFNREEEKNLGVLMKNLHKTDLFVIVDYPTKTRAFYTKFKNHTYSYSFDFIMRGEEILSGARRISDYDELLNSVRNHGVSEDTLKGYLEAFKYGVPVHGGCGIGFERLLKTFFDAKDIRLFTMFPRDPTRLYP